MANNKNIKINLDYAEFSGGIQDCQRKMGLLTEEFKLQQSALGNNATEVDKLTLKQSSLAQKIDLQIQIVEKAKDRFEAIANAEGATATQVDNAQKAYMKQITTLNQLTNELADVNNKLEESGETSNSASQSIENLVTSITTTTAVIASMISAVQQVAQAIGEVATRSTEWADDLETLSSQIGVSTTTLQEWAYASDFVDVSVETLQGSMTKLVRSMSEAQNGSTSAQAAFDSLGVSYQNIDGHLKSTEQVFYEVIDALGGIENVAERDAISMAIFGRSAQDLNTLIEAGSGSLQAYGQEAQQLGIIMSEDQIQALSSMQNSFDKLNNVMNASKNLLSASVAPLFASIADAISQVDPAILAVVGGFGSLISVVSNLAPLLQGVAAITQLLTMSKIATAAATTVETVAEAGLGATATATNVALLPQIAIALALTAALAGLAYAIYKIIDLLTQEADAADKAASSTEKFANASRGSSSSNDSTSNPGKSHYALGGRVSGKQVWVGEQGAELVELPSGSMVYNHQESRNMTSSNNVFNVTIDAHNVDDFNKVVKVFNGLSQSMSRGGKVNG